MGDLHPHSGTLADANGLANCLEHVVGLVPDVRGIGGAVLAQDSCQGQKLLALRVVARRCEQPAGHAQGTSLQALGQELLHCVIARWQWGPAPLGPWPSGAGWHGPPASVFTDVAGKPSRYWAKVRGSYSSQGAPALK